MLLQHFLDEATKTLRNAGIETARLDVLVLLEDALTSPRAHLLAHPEMPIPPPLLSKLNTFIVRRSAHVPLAYIRGRASFFGRNFAVNKDVLVPRPETEAMIELLLKLPLGDRPTIVDVGTGSGCVGITAALELPAAHLTLTDIDRAALDIAAQNARGLGARVSFKQQDLLEDDTDIYDVVLANLPYVPEDYPINQAAAHEPKLALFAGQDGLDLYRTLWRQIGLKKPACVLTEALESQHKEITGLAMEAGYQLEETLGLVQLFTLREQPQA
jgi:release factor glutamine methyltransferase